MNHFDALIENKTPDQRREWAEPVKRHVCDDTRRKLEKQENVEPIPLRLKPSMDSLCECGRRYGMHRVNDYLCPNPKWRLGNGQAQWLGVSFRRPD